LHIVMKLTHANRQPVAKLSDSPGKLLCDDETFLAYLRQQVRDGFELRPAEMRHSFDFRHCDRHRGNAHACTRAKT
jgi:nicotinic acid phosphoribosyltransferase